MKNRLHNVKSVWKEAAAHALPINSTSNKRVESGGIIHEPERYKITQY